MKEDPKARPLSKQEVLIGQGRLDNNNGKKIQEANSWLDQEISAFISKLMDQSVGNNEQLIEPMVN